MSTSVQITDRSKEAIEAKNRAVTTAMEAIGLQATKHAVRYISGDSTHPKRVKTNNLRSSISHQVAGDEAVYIGTNVEYAKYVHDGTKKMAPNRFLRDAAKNHADEYKRIIERYMKGGN